MTHPEPDSTRGVPQLARADDTRFPLMEKPAVGVLLACVAGLLNAWTFARTGTFATVQSGNVVSAGYNLAQGHWSMLFMALGAILAFGAGACISAVAIAAFARRMSSFSAIHLSAQGVLLIALTGLAAAPGIAPHHIALGISFVAGAQGNAFHRTRGMIYGNIAVTAVVQTAFSFVGRALARRIHNDGEPHLRWAGIYFLVLLGFAAGAALGSVLDRLGPSWAILAAAAITLAIAAIAALDHRDRVDPTEGPTP